MKDLSILIPSYNTRDITRKTLQSLITCLQQTKNISAEIIVVDNASTDGSVDMLKALESSGSGGTVSVHTVFLSTNVGYGKANNEALKVADSKYILYLNSDVIVDTVDFEDVLCYAFLKLT